MTAAQPAGGADTHPPHPTPAASPNGVLSPVPHPLEAQSAKPQPHSASNHPPSSSTGATSSPSSDTTTTTTKGDIESPHHPPASLPPPPPPSLFATCRNACTAYFSKWRGGTDTPLAPEPVRQLAVSWLGALLVILLLAALDQHAGPPGRFEWLIASFGASAVLMFGLPAAKLSQPRNVVGGHVISALCGIVVRHIIRPSYADGKVNFVSAALGMSLSLTAMQATGTTHPPAGATGLLAAIADPIPAWEGFRFLVTALAGSCIMVVMALLYNNLVPGRRYPTFW